MVKVVANSACDLSRELAEQYCLTIVPDMVVFSPEEQYRNALDLEPEQFYRRLPSCRKLPTTAHPNLNQYMQAFASAGDCEEILCIAPTGKMSGGYSTACAARELWMEQSQTPQVTVYDSQQISFGMGMLVQEACRLARKGLCAGEIVNRLEVLRRKVGVYFAMESLEYAQKGGRVGAIRVLAADLLKVKPILTFRDGLVRDIGIVRGYRNAVQRVVSLYKEKARFGGEVFLFHADRESLAQVVRQQLLAIDPAANIHIGWVGAVIGVYTGTGCLGMAFTEK